MMTRLIRPGGDVEHREEDAEEQQRRAEVPLDDDDHEGDRPHRDHRREVRDGRQAQRADPRVLLDEQGAVLRQVAGQEDDQDHLEQLGRLAAERPELDGQALAVDLGAEHEGQQQQADPGRGPRVLVAAQPAVRADDDRQGRHDGQGDEQPDELDLGEPERGAEERLLDEVLRQPLHQQQRDPAEQRRSSAAGSGRCAGRPGPGRGGRRAARRGRCARPWASYSRNVPVDRCRERDAADHERERDEPEQPELDPARSWTDRPEDARERRAGPRCAVAVSAVMPSRSLETHPDLADLQLVTEAHRRDAVDATAVDVRPVRAAEILEVPAPAAVGQDGVIGRRERIVDDDRVVDVAPERGDDVEPERVAGRRLAARRLEDDQAARDARPARAPRRAGRAAAPG